MRLKWIVLALAGFAAFFVAALRAMDWIAVAPQPAKPPLAEIAPLAPATRRSTVTVPITIPLAALRDSAERATPRTFGGKADNPVRDILQNGDINWTVTRGTLAASGAANMMALSAPLTGQLTVTGSLQIAQGSALNQALGNLLGGNVAKQIGNISIKQFNGNADIRGNVNLTSQPTLTPNWRIEPNLSAQVNLGDTSLSVAGARVGVPGQVKPVIDKLVNEQIAIVQARVRNDPLLEQTARREWAKMCRTIPLPAAGPGLPPLFLEMRPVRAMAAQPRVDAVNLSLVLGVEGETRISAVQTTPDCPFPALLQIVPPPGAGRIAMGLPIDMPFAEVDRIVAAQMVGRTFPDGADPAVSVTVKKASVTPSGDRLLISLLLHANAAKGFLSTSGDATVHIWGRPKLDTANQILQLADLELAVESEAAFGLLGAATRVALPFLQQSLAQRTTIDLKPFAATALTRIAASIAEFRTNADGVKLDASISALRLTGVAFDATTLRVEAEAEGTASAVVTALPGL